MTKYTGKTLADALLSAKSDLGADEEEIIYTVIEEKKGILGLGGSVTIEAEAKEKEPENVTDEGDVNVPLSEAVPEPLITETEESEEKNEPQAEAEVSFSMEDVKEFLFDYLGAFFTGIDLETECSIEEKNGSFYVNLNAENNAVLIGRAGKTLASLNAVVRAAVNARFSKRIDVLIDINHYKEDRYAKIKAAAKKTARQVQKSRVSADLDPMENDERKVVHKLLNNWHNIRTESFGEGSQRYVSIQYVSDPETENKNEEE